MDKPAIVALLRSELNARLQRMLDAAGETRSAATDGESKAEGKYDTRGLEASYLAAGQAAQVEELIESVRVLDLAAFPDWEADAPIASGALVEVEIEAGPGEELVYYLLAPRGGGLSLDWEGHGVTVLAPGSVLREKLEGRRAGEVLRDPPLLILEVY